MQYHFGTYCFDPARYALTQGGAACPAAAHGVRAAGVSPGTTGTGWCPRRSCWRRCGRGSTWAMRSCTPASWRYARRCTIPAAPRPCCTRCGGGAIGLWRPWRSSDRCRWRARRTATPWERGPAAGGPAPRAARRLRGARRAGRGGEAPPRRGIQAGQCPLLWAPEAPSLAARLGPEGLYHLLQTVVGLVQEVLQPFDGTLLPPTSASVTAVFGAPVAQEDHARRAVVAALALQPAPACLPRPAGAAGRRSPRGADGGALGPGGGRGTRPGPAAALPRWWAPRSTWPCGSSSRPRPGRFS